MVLEAHAFHAAEVPRIHVGIILPQVFVQKSRERGGRWRRCVLRVNRASRANGRSAKRQSFFEWMFFSNVQASFWFSF